MLLSFVACVLVAAAPGDAQGFFGDLEPLAKNGPLVLDVPVLDAPFNFAPGTPFPSMAQAVAISRDVHGTIAWAIDLGFGMLSWWPPYRWMIESVVQVLVSQVFNWVPFGSAWNHEEFHRAVLSHRGISSHDDLWELPFFASAISVSHVTDEALVQLKAEHPADLVRLHAAGMEGDVELTRAVVRADFFNHRSPWPDAPMVLLTRLNVIGYMSTCASYTGDLTTKNLLAEEGTDVSKRDFTGLDCTAWAYDAQRPDEPYTARGPHPSGVGLNRYRTRPDLTKPELGLLSSGSWWSFANLADLAVWDLNFRVPGTEAWRWTGGFAWQMTPFGWALTADLLARGPSFGARLAARPYVSQHLVLPGLEVELVRWPLALGPVWVALTPALGGWLQPANQRWDAREVSPGGFVRLRGDVRYGRFSLFAEVQAKSAGWLGGTVALEPALDGRVGVGVFL